VNPPSPESFEDGLARTLPRLQGHLASPRRRVPGVEPEDVAQEVVARALLYRASFQPGRAVWPWLRRLAQRVLVDQRQDRARRALVAVEPEAHAAEPRPAALDAREELELLLATLPAREREVLLRFHRDGQSVRDIAQALGAPEGTIKSHLSRARRRLAELPVADERRHAP